MRKTPMNIQEQVALFHARALKDFCKEYTNLCINHGRVCPFYNKKDDVCSIGCPACYTDEMISKERKTIDEN